MTGKSDDFENTLIEEPTIEKKQEIIDSVFKGFVLKFDFENVSKWKQEHQCESEWLEYFGLKWVIEMVRKDENVGCYLHCYWPKSNFLIETKMEAKIVGPKNRILAKKRNSNFSGKNGSGWDCFVNWDDMENGYVVDDKLRVELHVKIMSTSGIYKANLRAFDESTKHFSDMTLIVGEEKFYVSKLYLAAQSSYFERMFFGMFKESKQSEITLTGIDAEDFQKYLEVLYVESAIEESSVESILLVAEFYDTQIVVQKCEDFLLKEAKTKLKKKLQMAFRYNLDDLKKQCLAEIKTVADIRSVTQANIEDMDKSLIAHLLHKSISF